MERVARSWWMLVGLLMILLVVMGGYYGYLLVRQNRSKQVVSESELMERIDYAAKPPSEWGSDVDPTNDVVAFVIEAVDGGAQKLELRPIWPESLTRLGRIESVITCKAGDIRLIEDGGERGVTSQTLLEVMQITPRERMVLNGVCAREDCREISRDCQLFVNKKEL